MAKCKALTGSAVKGLKTLQYIHIATVHIANARFVSV